MAYKKMNLRVLVVEDVITSQFAMTEILESLGCTVDIASNGDEAYNMVQDASYNIVFMDCNMPIMDGYTATRKIRELGYYELPIVAVTTNDMSWDRENCLDAGMDDFVQKPVTKRVISGALKKYGEKHRLKHSSIYIDEIEHSINSHGAKAEAFAELVLSDLDRFMDDISGAFLREDSAALVTSLHSIRTVFKELGESEAVDLASRMQDIAEDGGMPGCRVLLDELKDMYLIIRDIVQNIADRHKVAYVA